MTLITTDAPMKNFFKKYPDVVLIVLAVVFSGIVAGYFFWGIGSLVEEVTSAAAVGQSAVQASRFDLSGAASLDWRGLVQ